MVELNKIVNELNEFYKHKELDTFATALINHRINVEHAFNWLLEVTKDDYIKTDIDPEIRTYSELYIHLFYEEQDGDHNSA